MPITGSIIVVGLLFRRAWAMEVRAINRKPALPDTPPVRA